MKTSVTLTRRFMNVPVTEYGPMSTFCFTEEGRTVYRFRIRLTAGAPDYWIPADLSHLAGRKLELEITGDAGTEDPFSLLTFSDLPEGAERRYREDLRPRYHFSALGGWLNDPNGLMFYRGKYFLFAQLNPFYRWCDNMHWMLAVSTDLFRWKDRGLVLYPDGTGQKFSGSGVVDEDNVSGLQDGDDAPLLLFYTAAGEKEFTQNIAYSTDGGQSWKLYPGNPVLEQIAWANRDPKVIRGADGKTWYMALYITGNTYAVFASWDLIHWEKKCELDLPGCMECPDLYEIALDGDPARKKMIFSCAGGQYLVGRMEGDRFVPETDLQRCYEGGGVYAPQSFYGSPDGRRIQIICSSNETMLPGEAFGKFMTLPCELTLRSTQRGPKLFTQPVRELRDLEVGTPRTEAWVRIDGTARCDLGAPKSGLFRAEFAVDAAFAGKLTFRVYSLEFGYDGAERCVTYRGVRYPLCVTGGKVAMDLAVDRCSAELFANGGELYLPMIAPLDHAQTPFAVSADVSCGLEDLRIAELRSLLPWQEFTAEQDGRDCPGGPENG